MRARTALTAIALAATTVLGAAGAATADSGTQGYAANSPGVISGNTAQIPVAIPLQVVGNSINVIGLLNPAFGNNGISH